MLTPELSDEDHARQECPKGNHLSSLHVSSERESIQLVESGDAASESLAAGAAEVAGVAGAAGTLGTAGAAGPARKARLHNVPAHPRRPGLRGPQKSSPALGQSSPRRLSLAHEADDSDASDSPLTAPASPSKAAELLFALRALAPEESNTGSSRSPRSPNWGEQGSQPRPGWQGRSASPVSDDHGSPGMPAAPPRGSQGGLPGSALASRPVLSGQPGPARFRGSQGQPGQLGQTGRVSRAGRVGSSGPSGPARVLRGSSERRSSSKEGETAHRGEPDQSSRHRSDSSPSTDSDVQVLGETNELMSFLKVAVGTM